MTAFDFPQFEKNLLEATRQVVKNLSKKKEAADICAFALFSDESGSSISAAANTTKQLTKLRKEDPDEYTYYKWNPAEWKYDSLENKQLDQLSDQLSSFSMELDEDAFDPYVAELFSRCLNVLLTLKADGVFDEFHNEFILLFDVSDYANTSNLMDWARQLNTQEDAAEYESWLTTEDR